MMANRNLGYTSNLMFGTTIFDRDWTYFVQRVNIPGVSFSNIEMSKMFTKFPLQGDTPNYEPLVLYLLCDEKMNVWKELFHLAQRMTHPETSDAKIESFESFLLIYDERDELILNLRFYGCQMQNIGSLDYDTTNDAVLNIPLTIDYAYYKIINDDKKSYTPKNIKVLKDTIVSHSRKELFL